MGLTPLSLTGFLVVLLKVVNRLKLPLLHTLAAIGNIQPDGNDQD